MPADRFGGRAGTQANRINLAIIARGTRGATASDLARETGEPRANVSAQLSWLHSRGLISRADHFSVLRGDRDRFRYFYHSEGSTSAAPTAIETFTPDPNRTFGLEIECFVPAATLSDVGATIISKLNELGIPCTHESYNHFTRRHWKIVNDSTLIATPSWSRRSGVVYWAIEVVSPVLRGAEGEEECRKVLDVLKAMGAKVNSTCGLHVHQGNNGWNTQRRRQLHEAYARLEPIIDAFMPNSRRLTNNAYCRSNSEPFGSSRYCKLNASIAERAERTHPTVEFRQHSGTVESSKVLPWIRFCRAMMNVADVQALGRCEDLQALCTFLQLSAEDTMYFKLRTAFFSEQEEPVAAVA